MHQKETVDYGRLDDPALFSIRAEMRAELERLPPHSEERATLARAYDASTIEIDARGRRAWQLAAQCREPSIASQEETSRVDITTTETNDKTRVRLLAVEVLLADPEGLENDALEGDLYVLRDHLNAALSGTSPGGS